MADDDVVTLQSHDDQSFQLEVRVAKMSGTLKDLIEDAGVDNAIPLPNVSGKILAKVCDYCNYHAEHPGPASDDIGVWDAEFCRVDQDVIFELILAANYLDIPGLLDVTCRTVANLIKGKTPEEIRKTFNIKGDFTEEEIEQVRKNNEWCEER